MRVLGRGQCSGEHETEGTGKSGDFSKWCGVRGKVWITSVSPCTEGNMSARTSSVPRFLEA